MSENETETSEDVTTRETSEIQYRTFALERDQLIDEENRRIRIGLTSEAPVERSFGLEVLDHSPESIDMSFLSSGRAPLLDGHDVSRVVGVVESAELDSANKRTVATVRFSESPLGTELWNDVVSGIRQNISCGYEITNMQRNESGDEVRCAFRPLEASIVSIPADTSAQVGLGRSKPNSIAIAHKEVDMADEPQNEAPQIDVDKVRAEVRDKTREEVQQHTSEILALGDRFSKGELAREHVQKGSTPAEFRAALLNQMEPGQAPMPPEADISPKETRQYSIMRAIHAASTGDWRDAGYEREVSDEIAHKTKKTARGFYVPTQTNWSKRDQTVSPDSAGGFLVGTEHRGDEFIEALYALAIIPMLGARRLEGLQGNVAIPRLSASVTNTAFVAEGSAPSEGAETFAQVTLQPRTLAGYVDISRKLALQSDPSIEAVVRDAMVRTFASAIDAVAINGGGSNEPTGIIANSDTPVVAMGTNGGAITYAKINEMLKTVETANAVGTSPAFLTNPSVGSALRQTPKQASGVEGNFCVDPDGRMIGYYVGYSTNVPSTLTKGSSSGNCSALIFGDFSQFFLAFWSGLDVVVDSSSLSTSGGTRLAFFQDVDAAVRNPNGFVVIKDITT